MSRISGVHDGRHVFVDVAVVGVSLSSRSIFTEEAASVGVFSEAVRALIDTGATSTSVTPSAARKLNLTPAGKRDMVTANGVRRARFYNFRIAMIDSRTREQQTPFYVLPHEVSGTEMNADDLPFDILLGMDVISQGDLTIRRDRTFSFEF